MRRIIATGVCAILLLLAMPLLLPMMFFSCRKRPKLTSAFSNARLVGMALFDFDSEYGSFPDADTIGAVTAATGVTDSLGSASSNELFRQLFVAGITTSEEIFYVRSVGVKKPDNVVIPGKALEKGECAFSYVLPGVSREADRPLLILGLVPGTRRFDPGVMEGKAVVLRMDQSIMTYPIRKDGSVIVNGMDFFDPRQPFWGGTAPVVAYPDLLPVSRSLRRE